MDKIDIDFETFSEVDLPKVGAHRYALDISTDPLCMAYSINNAEPKLWIAGRREPEEVFDLIASGFLVYAWNATFEICIWNHVLNWPKVPFDQWRDTQAIALNFALPAELKKCGEVLDVPVKKSAKGTRLINMLSKPCKPTKKFPHTRRTPETHPDLFDELYEYCLQDVKAEQAIHAKLPWELTEEELEIWRATFHKNQTGIPIDMPLVDGINRKVDHYLEEATALLPIITKGAVQTIGQIDKIVTFATNNGYPIDNLQAATVEEALADPYIADYPAVEQLLTIRSLAGKASVKKFKKIKQAVCEDDRVRDCLKYHRATTGREGGRLLQPQNMPRAEIEDVDTAIDSFTYASYEDTLIDYEMLIDTASALVRPSICASPGKHFKVADYNAVEARGVCWLADQNNILDLYREGRCVYTHMASKIYDLAYEDISKESRERFHGKQTILGCGYGMAWKKFQLTCASYGLIISDEEAQETIKIYRKENPKVVYLWRMLKAKAVHAIENPETLTTFKKISFMFLDGNLYMTLPNGKILTYPKAFVREEKVDWGWTKTIYHEGFDTYTKQWCVLNLTGTRLAENATQAVCREALMEAQLDLMREGYTVILTVHDEVVTEDDEDFGSLEEVCWIMETRSDYFEGFPLKAAGFIAHRYRK